MEKMIAELGGVNNTARLCGVSPAAVSQLKKRGGKGSLAKYISLLHFLWLQSEDSLTSAVSYVHSSMRDK
ncbi:hypothetical protein V8J88_03925 [Massilia sp. W12]|uniref:hypothetical protein n=1 Tax=Massilia sp. W12 TaxID=3126507 RepID=UPI0030CE17A2